MVAKISRFRKRNRSGAKVFFAGFLSIFFVAVIGFLIFFNLTTNQKRARLEEQAQVLEDQVKALYERQQGLKAGIQTIRSEDNQERVLREHGLYKKPGEEVITVLPPEKTPENLPQEQEKKVWWNPFTW